MYININTITRFVWIICSAADKLHHIKTEEVLMAKKYRTQFDLGLSDLETIEDALRSQAKQLSQEKLEQCEAEELAANSTQPDNKLMAIQSILGKLHNQKVWYAPQQFVPRG